MRIYIYNVMQKPNDKRDTYDKIFNKHKTW